MIIGKIMFYKKRAHTKSQIVVPLFHLLPLDPAIQWTGEIEEFCPNTKMLLVGCKSDLRTDLFTRSHIRQTPVSYDQVGECLRCPCCLFHSDRAICRLRPERASAGIISVLFFNLILLNGTWFIPGVIIITVTLCKKKK